MANILQNALSSLISINTNLWNKVSGIIDDNYIFYKSPTSGNLEGLIHGGSEDLSNWLNLNKTSKKLEVKIPYASSTEAGIIKLGAGLTIVDGVVSVKTDDVLNGGTAEKAASATFALNAGTANVAKSTSGTLTIGTQTFNGSADVTIDLSNTIELRAENSIPTSYADYTHPTLVYTPNGQTAIVTKDGIIPTSEEITDEITANAANKITTAKAVSAYVDDKIANAASKVSISTSDGISGATILSWTIDGVPGSIEIEKERWIEQAVYNSESNKLTFTLHNGGSFEMDATSLIKDYVAGAGLQRDENTNTINIVKDNNTDSKFLQIGADTIGLSGITDAISNAMSGAIELKYESDIPTSVSNYTRPTLVFTDDGETAIVYPEGNTVISTSEKTVDSIEEETPSSYIITVGAFKEYMETFDAGFVALLADANALNAEIKK